MNRLKVVIFGQAQKGKFFSLMFFNSISKLALDLGHPPEETAGIFFAIQALLYNRDVYFFRVNEEGFSNKDYLYGFRLLKNKKEYKNIAAICLPGVGDSKIIKACSGICCKNKNLMITTEKDLYDYLTSMKSS